MTTALSGVMRGVATVKVFSGKVPGERTLWEKISRHAGTLPSALAASRGSEETVKSPVVL